MSTDIETLRQRNRDAIVAFLNVFPEAGESFYEARRRLGLLAQDYSMELPYAPPGMRNKDLSEHHEARARWLSEVFVAWKRTHGPMIYETLDPSRFWVEAGGEGVTRFWGEDRPYRNDFAILFVVDDGRISLFREYFNPLALYPESKIDRFPFGG